MNRFRRALAGPFLAALLLLSGCGPTQPPRYRVSGQVLLNGQPLTAQPPLGQVKVQFLPDAGDPSKVVDPAECDYDMTTGKFTVTALDGQGVEAGKYHVAVYQYDPMPADKLEGRFDRENTPVVVEVKGADPLRPIELSQYIK